jgi:hypothetical protein
LFAKSDEEAGSDDRARPRECREDGDGGTALGTLRDGGSKIGEGRQGDPAVGDKGLHPEGIGGNNACIGGEGCGRFDGLDTLGEDRGRAHVMRTAEGFEGRTAGELHCLAGRPGTETITEERGVFLLKPVPHVRARVLEGAGQAVGEPHCIADHAAPVCDKLGESAHRGALRLERLQRVAMGA